MTITIDHMNEIISKYDSFIFDQWGVLHNGGNMFPHATEVLHELNSHGKEICIASNSGNRSVNTWKTLQNNGIDYIKQENIITSGEEFHLLFNDTYSQLEYYHEYQTMFSQGKFFLMNNDTDTQIFKSTPISNFTDNITEASIIILKGVNRKSRPIEDYYDILQQGLDKNLPLICINSDLVSKGVDGKLAICPGTLAEWYQTNHGQVFFHGKPHKNIFNLIKKRVGPDKRFLMIGDSFDTDIKGGHDNNIDTLFVHETGVHEQEKFSTLIQKYKLSPTFYIKKIQ